MPLLKRLLRRLRERPGTGLILEAPCSDCGAPGHRFAVTAQTSREVIVSQVSDCECGFQAKRLDDPI